MLLLRIILIMPLVQVAPFMMPSLGDLWKLAKLGWKIGNKIKDGYDAYESFMDDTSERIDKILAEVVEISNKIDGMESRLDQRLDVIVEALVSRITLIQKLDNSFRDLHKIIVDIDMLWDNFIDYSKDRSSFHNNTIRMFINTATGPQSNGLQALLNQMHKLIVPLRTSHIRDSLFLMMLKHEQETELITCDEYVSHQQVIYQIYSSVALTELRGFVMTAYAYGVRPLYEQGKFLGEVRAMEARFTMRTRDFLIATKEAMKVSSNRIRRCGPAGGHKRGQSFAEMEGLFQKYVINEADINPHNSCSEKCSTIGTQTYRRSTDSPGNYNYDRPCRGLVSDCFYGGGKMTVCDTKKGNSRRYHWFKSDDGTVYGDGSSCPGDWKSPSGWIRGFYACDYCICNCEDNNVWSTAQRAISFQYSRSDTRNNMVVTGVRLVQKERMMHLQVRQGKLMPEGAILNGSDSWVPLEDYEYATLTNNGAYFIRKGSRKELQRLGRDYAFATSDLRQVNLDDVMVPPGRVVVGVRFRHSKGESVTKDNPIRLEVYSMPYEYETGKVISSWQNPPRWHGYEDTLPKGQADKIKRVEVHFDKPDNPTKHNQNLPTTQPNLYVKIQASDIKKDAGQSTIPFWDIQEVTTIPSFALQGVGLFHKGHRDGLYGGYLAIRLLSLDFSDQLNTDMPDNIEHSYEQVYEEPLYSPTYVF